MTFIIDAVCYYGVLLWAYQITITMKTLASGQTTLQKLEAYQPTWVAVREQAERGTVDTKYGRKVFDGELRESWGVAERHMNGLLERYFIETAEVEFIQVTTDVELAAPHES